MGMTGSGADADAFLDAVLTGLAAHGGGGAQALDRLAADTVRRRMRRVQAPAAAAERAPDPWEPSPVGLTVRMRLRRWLEGSGRFAPAGLHRRVLVNMHERHLAPHPLDLHRCGPLTRMARSSWALFPAERAREERERERRAARGAPAAKPEPALATKRSPAEHGAELAAMTADERVALLVQLCPGIDDPDREPTEWPPMSLQARADRMVRRMQEMLPDTLASDAKRDALCARFTLEPGENGPRLLLDEPQWNRERVLVEELQWLKPEALARHLGCSRETLFAAVARDEALVNPFIAACLSEGDDAQALRLAADGGARLLGLRTFSRVRSGYWGAARTRAVLEAAAARPALFDHPGFAHLLASGAYSVQLALGREASLELANDPRLARALGDAVARAERDGADVDVDDEVDLPDAGDLPVALLGATHRDAHPALWSVFDTLPAQTTLAARELEGLLDAIARDPGGRTVPPDDDPTAGC